MLKEDFKIGQTVYVCDINCNFESRYNNISTATITKVGNKYVEIDKWMSKFQIHDGYEYIKDYSPSKKIYLSLKDIEEEQTRYKLTKRIRELVHIGGPLLPLNSYDLEHIVRILEGDDIDE